MKKQSNQDGFFTMIVVILIILLSVIWLAYTRVNNAN